MQAHIYSFAQPKPKIIHQLRCTNPAQEYAKPAVTLLSYFLGCPSGAQKFVGEKNMEKPTAGPEGYGEFPAC